MEEYAKNVLQWLQRRVSEAEQKDPNLRPMKDRINEIGEQIKSASESDLPGLIKQQNEAVWALINHVNKD